MLEEVYRLLEGAGRPRICVVGDVMLDTYVWGGVSRISPEGPIPVLRVQRREHRAGGALSVACMLRSLEAEVLPVGAVGEDTAAETLAGQLEQAGIPADGLVPRTDAPTATKTRYLGYVQSAGRALQQLLRVDEEDTADLARPAAGRVREAVLQRLEVCDLLIVQDMGKGLFGDSLLRELIAEARRLGRPAIVDPEKTEDYSAYEGATCVVPNRFETETALGMSLREPSDYADAARALLKELSLEAAVIKLDRDGIYFATAEGAGRHIPAHEREVADVTGAGDMVAAALGLALAAGADWPLAVRLANFAAGLEVTHSGATAISRGEMQQQLRAASDPTAAKIRPRAEMPGIVKELQEAGTSVAFTNGGFDLLHLGHVQLLQHAAQQADALVVGLNSDRSARKLKGPGRPINSERVRSRLLAAMAPVDYVVTFDEASVLPLIEELRPDVLVKGGDYPKEQVVGWRFVESYGGRVELAPLAEGYSTTQIIKRIAGEYEGED